jgi:hypothetical protein
MLLSVRGDAPPPRADREGIEAASTADDCRCRTYATVVRTATRRPVTPADLTAPDSDVPPIPSLIDERFTTSGDSNGSHSPRREYFRTVDPLEDWSLRLVLSIRISLSNVSVSSASADPTSSLRRSSLIPVLHNC